MHGDAPKMASKLWGSDTKHRKLWVHNTECRKSWGLHAMSQQGLVSVTVYRSAFVCTGDCRYVGEVVSGLR